MIGSLGAEPADSQALQTPALILLPRLQVVKPLSLPKPLDRARCALDIAEWRLWWG